MSYWIVSNVPSSLLLLGLIVLIAGGAVLIQFCVRQWLPGFMEGASNDSINFSFRAIALVYAVFIGFVVSAMWGQINGADTEARLEGTAGVQLSRDLTVFDTADSDRVRQSLLEYQRAAVAEWPRTAQGLSSPEVDTALRRLYTAYQGVQPRSETEKMLLATSFNNLDTLSRARTDRILLARTDTGPPPSLWAVILITSGLVLGLVIVQRADTPAIDYAMVALVGVLVAAQLFLVLVLSHPYIGEIATSRNRYSRSDGSCRRPPHCRAIHSTARPVCGQSPQSHVRMCQFGAACFTCRARAPVRMADYRPFDSDVTLERTTKENLGWIASRASWPW